MVRYGLAKLLRGVKALQTRKKSANGFENLLLHGLASHSEKYTLLLWLWFDLRNLHGNFGVTLKTFKPKFVAFLSLPV